MQNSKTAKNDLVMHSCSSGLHQCSSHRQTFCLTLRQVNPWT